VSKESQYSLPVPEPKVGETWYVRLNNAVSLATVVISDVSVSTVEFRERYSRSRYKHSDVEFVERALETKNG